MRTISLTARTSINAEETDEVWVFLVTVEHDALEDGPMRFSSDPTSRISTDPYRLGTVSRGDTYDFLPIGVVMPDESADTPPAIRVTIDNVVRELVPLLRSVSTPASVTIEMVLASAPDIVEVVWPEFDLVGADYEALQVTVSLAMTSAATEPYPAGNYSPAYFPALFIK